MDLHLKVQSVIKCPYHTISATILTFNLPLPRAVTSRVNSPSSLRKQRRDLSSFIFSSMSVLRNLMVTLMLLAHSSTLFSLLELTPLSTEHTLYLPQARADQWRTSFTLSPPSLEAPPASFPQFSKRLQERAHYLGFFSVAVIKIPDKTSLKEKRFFFSQSQRGRAHQGRGDCVNSEGRHRWQQDP